jgi:hypothetical protein
MAFAPVLPRSCRACREIRALIASGGASRLTVRLAKVAAPLTADGENDGVLDKLAMTSTGMDFGRNMVFGTNHRAPEPGVRVDGQQGSGVGRVAAGTRRLAPASPGREIGHPLNWGWRGR